MFQNFYPDIWMDSTYEIDFEALYQKGIRGLIFDIDNTLVEHGAPADQRAIALFHRLHEIGFSMMLLSNNKEPRVKMFCDAVEGASYIYKAGKPSKKRVSTGYGTDAYRCRYDGFYWRPAFYRCLGSQKMRYLQHFGKTNR